ncbi:MAG: transglutaminaseTgpA domain-containing protein [Phycisphaerae bacterium]|jgi:hypothetical protein
MTGATGVLRKIRWCLLVAVVLAFFAFASAEGTWPGFALLLIFGSLGWYVTEGRPMFVRPAADGPTPTRWEGLPRWVANVVLVGALLAALYRGRSGESVVSAFTAFLASIIVLKLWQKRDPGDYGQMLTMSLFLTIGATLNSNNLGVGLAVMVQTPVLMLGAMLLQIWNAQRRGAPTVFDAAADWRRLRRPLVLVATVSLLVAVAVSAVVFVIVPRQAAQVPGLGGFGRLVGGRQVGFTNQVDLRAGGITSESREVMLIAAFAKDAEFKQPVGSPDVPQYLRGAVLDYRENGLWREAEARGNRELQRSDPVMGTLDAKSHHLVGEVLHQRITLQSGAMQEQPVFHVHRGISFSSPMPAASLSDLASGTARIRPESTTFIYDVQSLLGARPRPRDESAEGQERVDVPRFRDRRGQVSNSALEPFSTPILRERNIEPDPNLRPVEEDAAAVIALVSYLRRTHAYSLQRTPPPVNQDPVVWWLENKQSGSCEYFAAALAGLCNSVGIDARVVAGYLAAEFDTSTNQYIVRRSDAHAWVEASIGVGQWRTYDATPIAENIQERMRDRFTLTGRLLGFLDGMQASWNTRVVAFDITSQQRLFSPQGEVPPIVERLTHLLRTNRDRDPIISTLTFTRAITSLLAVVFIGSGIALLLWGLLRLRKRKSPALQAGWAITQPQQRALLESITRRVGPRDGAVPLRDWVTRAAPPQARDALLASADALYAARFSQGETDIAAALAKLEAQVPTTTPTT